MYPLLSILHCWSAAGPLLAPHKFRGNGNGNGNGNSNGVVALRCVWAPCARGMDDWGGGPRGGRPGEASRPEEPGGSEDYPGECGEVMRCRCDGMDAACSWCRMTGLDLWCGLGDVMRWFLLPA